MLQLIVSLNCLYVVIFTLHIQYNILVANLTILLIINAEPVYYFSKFIIK